jgi:hypothetical protein
MGMRPPDSDIDREIPRSQEVRGHSTPRALHRSSDEVEYAHGLPHEIGRPLGTQKSFELGWSAKARSFIVR